MKGVYWRKRGWLESKLRSRQSNVLGEISCLTNTSQQCIMWPFLKCIFKHMDTFLSLTLFKYWSVSVSTIDFIQAWMRSGSIKVKPKHLHHHLVPPCSTSQTPCLLHVNAWDMGQSTVKVDAISFISCSSYHTDACSSVHLSVKKKKTGWNSMVDWFPINSIRQELWCFLWKPITATTSRKHKLH